jgi:hypothetical protein
MQHISIIYEFAVNIIKTETEIQQKNIDLK